MNIEYPGITGRELLEKLQELSSKDLEKRIVIGVMDRSGELCFGKLLEWHSGRTWNLLLGRMEGRSR
ncbi:MAG: hypothetical protein J6J03_06225 [Tyzzerella sp.]|nr:hypothetical protein [Tyzzerella sp.]